MNKNAFGELMDFPEAFLFGRIYGRAGKSKLSVKLCFLSKDARIFLEKSGNVCIKFIKCYKNIN